MGNGVNKRANKRTRPAIRTRAFFLPVNCVSPLVPHTVHFVVGENLGVILLDGVSVDSVFTQARLEEAVFVAIDSQGVHEANALWCRLARRAAGRQGGTEL